MLRPVSLDPLPSQPTLFDSAAASIVRKLCEIDAAIVSLENSTSTEGSRFFTSARSHLIVGDRQR